MDMEQIQWTAYAEGRKDEAEEREAPTPGETTRLVARLRAAAEEVEAFPHPSHCDHLHVAFKVMREAADALANQGVATPQGPAHASSCRWTQDDEGNRETGCGEKHVLIDGGPVDNHMMFCCYCGKGLTQLSFETTAEETDDEFAAQIAEMDAEPGATPQPPVAFVHRHGGQGWAVLVLDHKRWDALPHGSELYATPQPAEPTVRSEEALPPLPKPAFYIAEEAKRHGMHPAYRHEQTMRKYGGEGFFQFAFTAEQMQAYAKAYAAVAQNTGDKP